MIEGGNDYAAVYADMIVNMNFGEKDYGIIDEQVPVLYDGIAWAC